MEAVKRLNDVAIADHQTMQTLQQELAERDEKLLQKIDEGFQETNQHLESLETTVSDGFQEMSGQFDKMEEAQKETNQHLESLESGQTELKNEVSGLREEVSGLRGEVKGLSEKIDDKLGEQTELLRMLVKNTTPKA